MKNNWIVLAVIAIIGLATPSMPESVQLQPLHGMASFEFGRLEEVFLNESNIRDQEFLNRTSAWLVQNVALPNNIDIHLGVGVMSYTVIHRDGVPDAQSRRTVPAIARASGRWTPWKGMEGEYRLAIETGIFPFKYNSHAKNLGEYMFRTWVSPIQISTGGLDLVGTASGYLTGVRLDGYLPGGLHWNFFYTINMDHLPLKTQSLAWILDYSSSTVFQAGVGLQLENYIYDRESQIQPKKGNNMAYKARDAAGNEKYFDAELLEAETYTSACAPTDDPVRCTELKSVRIEQQDAQKVIGVDNYPVGGADTFQPQWTIVDSTYYSFKGEKLLAYASLNFASLLGLSDVLGENGLSVYAEAIILGVKSVPVWAETLKERTPVMFGFNLPTFKLLDVLSLEFEVLKLKYSMSTEMVQDADELPKYATNSPDANYDTDDWKFTIFAEKTVTPGFKVFFQCARDHFRTMDIFGKPEFHEVTQRGGGSLTDWGDFYWLLKFKYMF